MTNKNNAIVTTKVEGTAIQNYAEREVVRELVDRMMSFHPAAADVGKQGMRMAAQMAILMNASPLPGTNEIHIWKDNKGKVKVEPGVNYWRRRSREHGDVFWIVSPRPMNEDEIKYYNINSGVLAAICRGVRKKEMFEMMKNGFSKQEVFSGVSFTGIAIVSSNEYAKNSKPLIWTALKNAEKDFYRQAFPFTPNEMYAVAADGLVFGEDGDLSINSSRLDFEAEAPREYQELTDGEVDQFNEDLFGMGNDVRSSEVIEVDAAEQDVIINNAEQGALFDETENGAYSE